MSPKTVMWYVHGVNGLEKLSIRQTKYHAEWKKITCISNTWKVHYFVLEQYALQRSWGTYYFYFFIMLPLRLTSVLSAQLLWYNRTGYNQTWHNNRAPFVVVQRHIKKTQHGCNFNLEKPPENREKSYMFIFSLN